MTRSRILLSFFVTNLNQENQQMILTSDFNSLHRH